MINAVEILSHIIIMFYFQIGILKRVLEEVEKVMHEFKGTLYKTMEDPQIDLTDVSLQFNATL